MSTRVDASELLIFGYISSIQALFGDNQIIPREIYELCLLFYKSNGMFILWPKIMTHPYHGGFPTFVFGICDINKRQHFTLKTPKIHKMNQIHLPRDSNPCHFTKLRFKQQTLNGFFALILNSRPYLCLYDPCTKETKYEYLSPISLGKTNSVYQPFITPKQFLFIEHNQRIIYEWNGKLYQLDLNTIETDDHLTKFVEIDTEKSIDLVLDSCKRSKSWLKMVYLPNHRSIFAVKCVYIANRFKTRGRGQFNNEMMEKFTKCRLFDIDNGIWTELDNYTYLTRKKRTYNFRVELLCWDGNNRVYMSDIDNNLSYFDLKNKKWSNWKLKKPESDHYRYSFWVDNNILFRIQLNTLEDKFVLDKLELTDGIQNSEWVAEMCVNA